MAVGSTACPLCGREQPEVPRYPGYLCQPCVGRATTADGRALYFTNTSMSGGFAAWDAETKELCDEVSVTHVVYVDGVRCWADEARFGGIVVQPRPLEGES